MPKLWGGHYQSTTHHIMETFSASHKVDRFLFREDIRLNIAYSHALTEAGILSQDEQQLIEQGLREIKHDIEILIETEDPTHQFSDQLEDIHTHIEHWLTEKIGDSAKKLHTGKSRNDQVVTDLRLYLLHHIPDYIHQLEEIIQLLQMHGSLPVPLASYTHLQKAQPVTLAMHMGVYINMFKRDIERLKEALHRVDVMPLGAGALAGNPFLTPEIRTRLAQRLGFHAISDNSMDAVSDRDFVVDILSAFSLLMIHFSRLGEEWVLWSSHEFGYITIGDAFTTGSSIMPQKKNPDAAELIRGKTGRVIGSLNAMLITLKGLPLTYNRDLQEDKDILFSAMDIVWNTLTVVHAMIPSIQFNTDKMKSSVNGFILATRVADYLVKKGLPFREAHAVVGRLVTYCLDQGQTNFNALTIEDWKRFCPLFEEDTSFSV